MRARELIVLLVGVILISAGRLHAHQIAELSMSLRVQGDRVTGVIGADAAYMLPEFRGDEDEEAKDLAWLREQGPAGWEKIERESERYLRECLKFESDGVPLEWTFGMPELRADPPAFMTEGEAEELPILEVHIEARLPPSASSLEALWSEPFGVVLIVTTGEGESAEILPMVSGERATLAGRVAEMTDLQPIEPSPGSWIKLGFVHILPGGLDHILFVLGFFILIPKWKPLLAQTITFTLAHSLSLAAAALGWVSFPATPVEVMIAASIAWVGFENLWVKDLGKGRLALVGLFGLIHGLGFASVLADLLPAGRPGELPAALLGFNVGVELGQIAVLAIAFACFGWLGKKFARVRVVGSVVIGLAGLVMIAERLAGIEIVPFL